MARGDFEAAASAYREAANAAPADASLWLRLARAELMGERPARAREAFERVAALRPRDPRPVVEVGFTHELERAYDQALQSYERALERAPGSAYAHRVLGTRLLRWGQAEGAISPLTRALELDEGHVETWKALAMAQHHAGHPAAAGRTFERGAARHPESVELLLGLAAVQVNDQQFAEALATYGEVLELRPGFAAAHVGRALLLHELGRPDEAEAAFVRAVEVAADPRPYAARLRAYRRRAASGPRPTTIDESADGGVGASNE